MWLLPELGRTCRGRHGSRSGWRLLAASCQTMEVEGYIIEGHVPAEAIARLLRERPEGVTGLAVPGMPLGSPGMEMGDRVQPYEVIAFGPDGQKVFASYP